MYKYIRYLFPFLQAFLSTVSFSATGKIIADTNYSNLFYDNNLVGMLIFVLLIIFYSKFRLQNYRFEPIMFLLAAIFSSFMIIGKSFKFHDGFDWIFYSKKQFVFMAFILIGYFIFFYTFLRVALCYFKKIKLLMIKSKKYVFFQKNVLIKSMGVIMFFWLPYLIAYYPGTIVSDVFTQLNSYFGVFSWSDWHPILDSLIMGFLMNIGRTVLSDNFGAFLITLFQSLLFSFSLSYSIYSMKKWKIPDGVCLLILFFYSLHPLFAFFAQVPIKDVFFSSFVIVFVCILIDCLRDHSQLKKRFFLLLLTSVLVCLTRHNGIYLIVPSFCVLTIASCVRKKSIRYGVLLMFLSAVIYLGSTNAMITLLNAEKGSVSEAFSIPFQQTARYVSKHSEEVTEEEKTAIANILDYDSMKEVYNPSHSNPIKNNFDNSATYQELFEYFRAWGKMFLKHPLTYIEALIAKSYAYYCPDGNGIPYTQITYTTMETNPAINTGFFDIYSIDYLEPSRRLLLNITNFLAAAPVTGPLFYPAFYTWITLITVAYVLIKKQYLKLVAFVPIIMNFLVCIASPLNGCFRYYLPNFCLTFLLLSWCIWGRLPDRNRAKQRGEPT